MKPHVETLKVFWASFCTKINRMYKLEIQFSIRKLHLSQNNISKWKELIYRVTEEIRKLVIV